MTNGPVIEGGGAFLKNQNLQSIKRSKVMLLTVKKQVEETVEVKTPAYYKDYLGNHHYINEAGIITTVRRKMINMWTPEDGKTYTEEIETVVRLGEPCTKEEFDKAYAEVIAKLDVAVGWVAINS